MHQFLEISNQMEVNGEVSNFGQKIYVVPYYIIFFFKVLAILQEGGFTPVPPTLLVIKVVLLHKERFVESFNSPNFFHEVT